MPAMRRLPLALRILIHTPSRLAVSVAGILLAVVLMFSQAGFRFGVLDSQAELIRRLNGELMLIGRLKALMYVAEPVAGHRLHQARAVAGVASVSPLYIESGRSIWQPPGGGNSRPIRVLAFDPDNPVFDIPEVIAARAALKRPNTVLFDELARDYYGRPTVGAQAELARRRVTVVGTFQLGTDLMTDGNVIMSDRNFLTFFPPGGTLTPELDEAPVGVVRLEPGADPIAVQRALRQALPDDVRVLTRQEFIELETKYWRENTATGAIFNLGMTVGFFIGIVICYQVLFSNVSNYLPQFATLKAMGFNDRYLIGVVLQQGLFLAILAFVPGVFAAQALLSAVSALTGLLLFLTPVRIAFIFVLTVLMCMISGIIAVRRVMTADPAEVFR